MRNISIFLFFFNAHPPHAPRIKLSLTDASTSSPPVHQSQRLLCLQLLVCGWACAVMCRAHTRLALMDGMQLHQSEREEKHVWKTPSQASTQPGQGQNQTHTPQVQSRPLTHCQTGASPPEQPNLSEALSQQRDNQPNPELTHQLARAGPAADSAAKPSTKATALSLAKDTAACRNTVMAMDG